MEKKIITKEQWQSFISANSLNTYNLICGFLILHLWECGVETKEEAKKELHKCKEASNITGFQADNIIAKALKNKPDWKLGMDND